MADLSMYRGESLVVKLGPCTVDGVAPASTLSSCNLRIVDDPDTVVQSAIITGTVTDGTNWRATFTVAPGDTSGWSSNVVRQGRKYYYTILCTAADGSVKIFPIDDDGNPSIGTLTIYERAQA